MSSDLSVLTKFFTMDPEELIALKRRVMEDRLLPHGQIDAIYCVGGTRDTQGQGLATAAMYWLMHKNISTIAVLRGTTGHEYCGFEFCRDGLIEYGVDKTVIVPIDILPQDRDRLNTYTEGKALLYHAGTHQWRTIIVCAPFFHQIRASSMFISLMKVNRQLPELWIFNLPGHPGDLFTKMKHSQGVVEGDLFEFLISELCRLFRYHDKGDICSCAELLAYYDRRDKEVFLHGYK